MNQTVKVTKQEHHMYKLWQEAVSTLPKGVRILPANFGRWHYTYTNNKDGKKKLSLIRINFMPNENKYPWELCTGSGIERFKSKRDAERRIKHIFEEVGGES